MDESIQQLKEWMDGSKRIVFFGGAGVSTASGIPDFRSAHGLYTGAQGRSYEEMLSHTYFVRHTDSFWAFYRRVMLYPNAKPNGAHHALARLEEQGKLSAVITQNIDGLHQAAGNHRVWELHGTVHQNLCMRCGEVHDLAQVLAQEGTPVCRQCGATLKPDVVLYGEQLNPDVMEGALAAIAHCDLLIVGGTSLVVHPAASFITYRRPGTKLVLINRDATPYDDEADLVIRQNIAQVLDEAVGRS